MMMSKIKLLITSSVEISTEIPTEIIPGLTKMSFSRMIFNTDVDEFSDNEPAKLAFEWLEKNINKNDQKIIGIQVENFEK
jgi:hypothetical protein